MKIEVNYASACDGKMAFRERKTAERVANNMNEPRRAQNRKNTGHAPAQVYKCGHCGWWHITGIKKIKK